MRIMMLSVTKRSSVKVKFWIFENFMSPQFKLFLEDFSKQINFEYGLVSYKWPEWLRQQTGELFSYQLS